MKLVWTREKSIEALQAIADAGGSHRIAAAELSRRWDTPVSKYAMRAAIDRHRANTHDTVPLIKPVEPVGPITLIPDVDPTVPAPKGRPWVPPEERDQVEISIENAGAERIFAVASDIHVGSKYFLRAQFEDFVGAAYAAGARVILGPGDNLDGCYRHSQWEETHQGFAAQATYATEVFPRHEGLRYYLITGNHDETFEAAAGVSVCQSLQDAFTSSGRADVHMVGERGAYVRLRAPNDPPRGLIVELWHPRGSPAYAVSYALQKKIEGYGVGKKPDMVLAGHWHQQVYFCHRGVHAFSCGTFHGGGGAFGRSLRGGPEIGGWIVRYRLTPGGTVREVSPTWRGYQEVETVREVGLG